MRPSEAMAALVANEQIGVVLDRRRLDGARAPSTDLQMIAEIDLGTASSGVFAALVVASVGGALPRRDQGLPHSQIRLMDRFYLPAIREQEIVGPMFDMAADIYDTLTDRRRNLQTASLLLRSVTLDAQPNSVILDYGCGTGVAIDAVPTLGVSVKLLGVDLSDAMLSRAAERGLDVLPIAAWRVDAPVVDGAIANFVLHYGVSNADLMQIARSLRPNARFAGNVFGAEAQLIERVTSVLESEGLLLEVSTPLAGTGKPDLLLSFRKPG